MEIIPSASNCSLASCLNDLDPGCPSQLVGPRDSSGNLVGCKSACVANLDNAADSSNCCTGSHNTAATCPASGVQFYSYFKNGCPNSYAYAFDEGSGTALWTCNSTLKTDYRLTFCPPVPGGQSPAPISAVPASLIPSGTPTSSSSTTGRSSSSTRASSTTSPRSGAVVLLHVTAPWTLSMSFVAAVWLLIM